MTSFGTELTQLEEIALLSRRWCDMAAEHIVELGTRTERQVLPARPGTVVLEARQYNHRNRMLHGGKY